MPTLADEIDNFIAESPNPVLFAGAGVSARAGLPTWGGYVNSLAEGVRAEDLLTATLMIVEQMRATEVQLEAASFEADATFKAMLARTFSDNGKNDSLEIRDVAAVA